MSQIIITPTTETQKKDAEQSAQYAAQFQQLQNNIDAETSRRIASDTSITNALNTEIQNRTDAVTAIPHLPTL